MEYVIKRDGTKVLFDKSKIVNAIEKAIVLHLKSQPLTLLWM